MTDFSVDQARSLAKHDLIEAYSALPPYPENRVRLLYWFLSRSRLSGWRDVVALAVSLAQFGLETHDLVSEPARDEPLPAVRKRQLTVLAGDYFNGRFYELLSQAGGLEAIRLVSRAMCEVNRLKAGLYEKWRSLRMTAGEYLDELVMIKSGLFTPFTCFMQAGDAERFPVLLRALVRCEVIGEELAAANGDAARPGYVYWHLLQHGTPADREALLGGRAGSVAALAAKYKVTGLLEQMLDHQLAAVRRLAESFGSESLLAEIGRILDSIAGRMPVMKTANDLQR